MSSCISVSIHRIGAVTTTATKEPDAITGVACTAVGGVAARVSHVCTPNIRHPYLRIEPEVIWVVPDWAVDNSVFSNVTWNIH